MRTLYRIESLKDGLGLFISESNSELPLDIMAAIDQRHENHSIFPAAADDIKLANLINETPEYKFDEREFEFPFRFAYCSIRMVRKAIHFREMKVAENVGFRLYKLTVKNCLRSKHQAVFLPDNIVKKELNIETIYK